MLRGSVYSGARSSSTVLVPNTQSFAALTAQDVVLDVPVQVKRAARYSRLVWKPSVTESIRINIAVYRRLLRQIEVFQVLLAATL